MTAPDSSFETQEEALAAVRDNERILGVLLTVHGLVHVVGFLLTWEIYAPEGFSYDDVWPEAGTLSARAVGVAWLVVAIVVMAVGGRLSAGIGVPPAVIAAPLAASIVVCATAFPSAIPGATISGVVLIAMLVLHLRREAAA